MLLIISLRPKKFSENNPNKLVKRRDAQRLALLLSVAHALALISASLKAAFETNKCLLQPMVLDCESYGL
jgi:hypothetical protein